MLLKVTAIVAVFPQVSREETFRQLAYDGLSKKEVAQRIGSSDKSLCICLRDRSPHEQLYNIKRSTPKSLRLSVPYSFTPTILPFQPTLTNA